MKDLKVRVITAIVLIAVLLPVVFFGGVFIGIFCGLACLGATYELEKMYKGEEKWSLHSILALILSVFAFVTILLSVTFKAYEYILLFVLFLFIIFGFLMIFDKGSNIETLSKSLLSIFYPAIGFASLALVRNFETNLYRNGLFILVYVALICFSTDCFAYFFGMKFGKHKLAPVISPKKSWEGSIAGTAFAIVIPTVFSTLVGLNNVLFPNLQNGWALVCTILLSFALSVIDEIGDLFASKLKRHYGIKDYSQIFPGHGGILDRFDSYIFVGVAVLLLLLI